MAQIESIPDVLEVRGLTLPVEVIRFESAELQLGVGEGIGAGTRNVGSIAGFLRGPDGRVYALSAAHVLGESIRAGAVDAPNRIPVLVGDAIFDYGPRGVIPPSGLPRVGALYDRAVLDFSGQFPRQNIDAALVELDADPGIDASALPHGPPAWVQPGDEVRVLGVGTRGGGAPGVVRSVDFMTAEPLFSYMAPDGRRRPILQYDLAVAEYSSLGGDSGGLVVRAGDDRAVGLHIGVLKGAAREGDPLREYALFVELPRVLGRWPDFEFLSRP